MNLHLTDLLLAAVPIAWLLVSAISCFGVYWTQRGRDSFLPESGEPTVLIIPVHGVPPHLADLWRGISRQSYRSLRVVFAVESSSDPAYAALHSLEGGPRREIVVAGMAARRGQKIHNLLAALGTLRDDDRVIVFADADIVPCSDWMARLVKWQKKDNKFDVVSGCRWMIPDDERWATAFVCVISSSFATALRFRPFNIAWGGSIVIHRNAIAGLELKQLWDRAVSDDLTLTRSAWTHKGTVHRPRTGLVLSPVSYGWKDAIRFARRQYILTRIHAPWHWALMAAITTLPLAGWIVALPLALNGSIGAISVIMVANILDHMRAFFRRRVPKRLWNLDIPDRLARLDRWGTPLWLLVNAVVVWSTLTGRHITWAGRCYLLDGEGSVLRIDAACGSQYEE